MWLELWQNYGMSYEYQENTEVEVLPVVDLLKRIGEISFFFGQVPQVVEGGKDGNPFGT